MTRNEIIALAVAVLILLLLLYLLLRHRRFRGAGDSEGDGEGSREASAAAVAEHIEAARRREAEVKAGLVRQVMEAGDEILVRQLLRRAGQAQLDPKDVSSTGPEVRKIAESLQLDALEAFRLAATQTDFEIDLERKVERRPALSTTDDIDPEAMTDLAQMHAVLPEQMMMEDDAFYAAMAEQRLTVLQPYEEIATKKRLYLLLDVSGSMETGKMRDGLARHVWARGVAVNLLLKALRGEAEYVCRAFDGQAHAPIEARTEAEAIALMDHLLDRGFGGGGTDIMRALRAAVADIRSRGEAFETDILLISDGESELDARGIEALLGSDIRLHVMQIGGAANPTLRSVAATCREL